MIRRVRKGLFWTLLGLSLAGAVWWTLYVPRRTERLARLLPDDALWVSAHTRLAERWKTILSNPLAHQAGLMAGLSEEEWPAALLDKNLLPWVDILGADETVLAYAPVPQSGGRYAWWLGAWVGARSQTHRWMLSLGLAKGVRAVETFGGRVVWEIEGVDPSGRMHLSLALEEGFAFLCYSEDPRDMRSLLDRYDRARPEAAAPERLALVTGRDRAPDRGVLTGMNGLRLPWRIDSFTAEGLEATVRWPEVFLGPMTPSAAGSYAPPQAFAGRAQAVLGARRAALRSALRPRLMQVWQVNLWHVFDTETAGDLWLGMFGDEDAGRLQGLRVPALVVSCAARDPAALGAGMAALFDRLNSYYRWGLVPRAVEAGARSLYAVEGTAATSYSEFPFEERIAYTQADGALWASTSAGALRRLMTVPGSTETAVPAPPPADALAWLSMDLNASAKTLRGAISVFSLKLVMDDARGTEALRNQLRISKDWIGALAAFGRLEVRLTAEEQTAVLHLRLGAAAPAAEKSTP